MSSNSRTPLEVADVFRLSGDNYKAAHRGHLSLAQLKVMSAIERCRSAQLGAHHLHREHCDTDIIAYNSCRNRPCRETTVRSVRASVPNAGMQGEPNSCCLWTITMWYSRYRPRWRNWPFTTKH